MKPFIRTMKALSDPSRVRIIKLLEQRELCVCEIQALIGLAQSTVSKHLKILEEAGFIDFKKDGLWIIYRLTTPPHSPYVEAMLSHLPGWLGDDPDLKDMFKRLPFTDRSTLCQK
jgi:ArsR family transcriptional regulator